MYQTRPLLILGLNPFCPSFVMDLDREQLVVYNTIFSFIKKLLKKVLGRISLLQSSMYAAYNI